MTTKSAPKNKTLKRTEFGNPILREVAQRLTSEEIASAKIKRLIADMRGTLSELKLGVGLAAPQVGQNKAMAIIAIQPTEHRPDVDTFDLVFINPKITSTQGRRQQLWEGCISAGPGKAGLFAKVPRYQKIRVAFTDEKGERQQKSFEGLVAHAIQHEVDHLNGILFVDRVKDTSSYMTYREYVRRVAKKPARKQKSLLY